MESAVADAFLVTVLGMTGVLVFLLLLVLLMQLIIRLAPPPAIVPPSVVAVPAAETDPQLIAVLQAAVLAREAEPEDGR